MNIVNFFLIFQLINIVLSKNPDYVTRKIQEALCKLECYEKNEHENCFYNESGCECTNVNEFHISELRYDDEKLKLKCRNDDIFYLEWENGSAKNAFFLQISSENSSFFTEITFCNHFVVENIESDTLYNFTLWSVNGHNVSVSKPLKIDNFNRNDIPLMPVSDVNVELIPNFENIHAEITWKPAEDLSCYYEIILYCTNSSNDYDTIPAPEIYEITDPTDLFNVTIEDLNFGFSYAISIRSKDSKMEKESSNKTIFFNTPTCLEIHKNLEMCEPEQPKNVTITEIIKPNKVLFDIELKWMKPEFEPNYYIAKLLLVNTNASASIRNISGSATNVTFENIELSSYYQIHLQAISNGGQSLPTIIDRLSVIHGNTGIESFNILMIILGILGLIFLLGLLILPMKKQRLSCENLGNNRNQYEKDEKKIQTKNETDKWEMSMSDLNFDKKLGEGAFGIVWQATLIKSQITVACKTLKDGSSSCEEKRQLQQEIDIMKYVGKHPNIVSMLGCVTNNVQNGPILIVEYCSKGDLLSYLRNIYNKLANCFQKEDEIDEIQIQQHNFTNKLYELDVDLYENELGLKLNDVISFGRQIAMGMEYLSNQKVLHRDLAARNILMCDDKKVKVSDFGLSRDVYVDSVYCKTTNGRLPIRWMALESLTHQIYTSQSDVWSFGVVIWEMFSLGAIPYPGVETYELLRRLKRGERMTKPQLCTDEMYNLMLNCWKENPNERPNFTNLRTYFEKLLGNETEYLDLSAK